MKQNLPWSVSGIPPEAREAARAAASREGLSLGDWLTQRILDEATARAFADEQPRSEQKSDWPRPARPSFRAENDDGTRRDRDDLIARIARAEAETESAFRRIDDTLRGMTRRLETAERSQNEASRAMGVAAADINSAVRDQARAFSNLAERIDHIEHHAEDSALKDAVRGLHLGLSKLADQIARTANESSTQVASLAANVETLAGKLNATRDEAGRTGQAFDSRIAALAERVKAAEESSDGASKALRTALGMFESRLAASEPKTAEIERTSLAVKSLEQTVEKFAERLTAAETRATSAEDKVQETLGRHLSAIERSLESIAQRLDAGEKQNREALAELRTNLSETGKRLDTMAKPAPFAAAELPPAAIPVFDLPPFPEAPPFQAAAFPPPPPPPLSAETEPPPFEPVATANEPEPPPMPQATAQDYIAAARRAAALAAAESQAQHTARGGPLGSFRDVATDLDDEDSKSVSRKTVIALIVLLALIAALAGIFFARGLGTGPAEETVRNSKAVGALFKPNQPEAPGANETSQPQAAAPAPADENSATKTTEQAPLPARPLPRDDVGGVLLTPQAAPNDNETSAQEAPPAAETASPSTITAPPAAKQNAPQQSASLSPPAPAAHTVTQTATFDRVLAKAKKGNAKAELLAGLEYLEGDGVAPNNANAMQWLKKAADHGEAVAQYRLGTIYERGRGVPADPKLAHSWYEQAAKHGNRKAMHNLAVSFAQGMGTAKNFQEAARWFKAAAQLGLVDSQFNLAVLYERGLGVPPSLQDAYTWYAIAGAQGDAESKTRLDALSTQLSPTDREAAEKAAAGFHQQPLNVAANEPPTIVQVVP